jgi:hypothetical protein
MDKVNKGDLNVFVMQAGTFADLSDSATDNDFPIVVPWPCELKHITFACTVILDDDIVITVEKNRADQTTITAPDETAAWTGLVLEPAAKVYFAEGDTCIFEHDGANTAGSAGIVNAVFVRT